MHTLLNAIWRVKIWKDTSGQDLTEYALTAGFIATAAVVIAPEAGSQISTVLSRVVIQLGSISGGSGGTMGGA